MLKQEDERLNKYNEDLQIENKKLNKEIGEITIENLRLQNKLNSKVINKSNNVSNYDFFDTIDDFTPLH